MRQTLQALCPGVDPAVLEEFLSRMDEDYFARFPPEEIAQHVAMAAALNDSQPVRLEIAPRGEGMLDLVVVAFDYFAEFSILSGLFASHGFDIRSGRVYTFSRAAARPAPPPPGPRRRHGPRPSPAKIVDVFRVQVTPGADFGPAEREALEAELVEASRLLGSGRAEEARARQGRRFVEHVSRTRRFTTGRLEPVEVRFEDDASRAWTVLDVRAADTPGFLYAFSNALALRGIYIHKVEIDSIGSEVHDRFWIADRQGRPIESPRERETLQRTVVLIKQFTHFLPRAPDPVRAVRYFDQFLDKLLATTPAEPVSPLVTEETGLELLAHLLGSSEFLWEEFLRNDFEHLLPVLEEITSRELVRDREALARDLAARLAAAGSHEERKRALNAFKDRELFYIDLRLVKDPRADLVGFSHALTDLAEVVLQGALDLARQRMRPPAGAFAICGLGKLGGRELGYASDIEACFVCEGGDDLAFEYLAREILEIVEARQEGVFHLDLRLRPYGSAGPLASPWEAWRSYYSEGGGAYPFERQALIKLRFVAGDEELGRRALEHRDRFVYSGRPWELAEALHLRERQERELVASGTLNAKYSPGGLVDIEYTAQYLQILHGHEHPELRTPTTLVALDALRGLGILSPREHAELRDAYTLLRRLIEGLRMAQGNARDLVVPAEDSDEMRSLARRMGDDERDWSLASRRLSREVRERMARVREIFAARFSAATARPV
jgi:glutamate-ammonia-ligase adenylyltransferase